MRVHDGHRLQRWSHQHEARVRCSRLREICILSPQLSALDNLLYSPSVTCGENELLKPTHCTLVIKSGDYSNKQSQLILYMYMSRRFSFVRLFRNILLCSDTDTRWSCAIQWDSSKPPSISRCCETSTCFQKDSWHVPQHVLAEGFKGASLQAARSWTHGQQDRRHAG